MTLNDPHKSARLEKIKETKMMSMMIVLIVMRIGINLLRKWHGIYKTNKILFFTVCLHYKPSAIFAQNMIKFRQLL